MKKLMFLIMLGFGSVVYADDINQRSHLPPDAQNKINKQVAMSYIQGPAAQTNPTLNNVQRNNNPAVNPTGGAQMSIGNISNVRVAPKEIITYSRESIINVCFHCR